MGYRIGIDIGTTYCAAASTVNGRAEAIRLGSRAAVIPSVVFAGGDGTMTVGDAAEQLGSVDASRTAREFKRRVGDSSLIRLGATMFTPEELMACLVPPILERAAELGAGPPERVALTFPANWAPYKRNLLLDSVGSRVDADLVAITEPEAAALYYAGTERIDPGQTIAVYDLGGGTFDAAILRRNDHGFEIIGRPEGVERLGGIDFDSAVLAHANRFLDGAIDHLDPRSPTDYAVLARLRAACTAAKEALSADTDTSIPISLPSTMSASSAQSASCEVRLTRSELETMIRPALADSVAALRRAVRSAGIRPSELAVVLLVGGSSRIPLVAQLVGAELGRPVAVDVHPKHAVALGAALAAAFSGAPRRTTTATARLTSIADATDPGDSIDSGAPGSASSVASAASRTAPADVAPPAAAVTDQASSGPARFRRLVPIWRDSRTLTRVVVVGTVCAAAVGGWLAARSSGGGDNKTDGVALAAMAAPCPTERPERFVCMSDIRVENGHLVVPIDSTGLPGDPPRHLHFFLPVGAIARDIDNAGTGGADGSGGWIPWDAREPFGPVGSYSVEQITELRATKLCVLTADTHHKVVLGTGHCLDLPAEAMA